MDVNPTREKEMYRSSKTLFKKLMELVEKGRKE